MRVVTTLVCALVCVALPSKSAFAELNWASSYAEAYKKASAEKKELFVYFEPTKPSSEMKQFTEKTLVSEGIVKELESRVVFKISTEQKLEEGSENPLSKESFFKTPNLHKYGGWVVIDFAKSEKGVLKIAYAFEPPTPSGVFAAASELNVMGLLTGKQTPSFAADQAVVSNSATTGQVQGAASSGSWELDRLNNARRNAGLHALHHDSNLYALAQQRAAEMSRRNSMDHNIHNWGGCPHWSQHGARYEGLGNTPEGACYATWRGNYGITHVGTACVGNYCVNIYR